MPKEKLEQLLEQVLRNRIRGLKISDFSIGEKIFDSGIGEKIVDMSSGQTKLLAKAISENTSLEKIMINWSVFPTDVWKIMLETLGNHPKLEYLGLVSCTIDTEIAKIISVAVTNSQTLRYLDLSSDDLDYNVFPALTDAFMNSPGLRALDLHNNDLGPDEAKLLSKILARSRLEYLDISENQLEPTGGMYIAEGVTKSRHLRTLVIHSSLLGSAGVKAIADAAASSRTLEDLALFNNIEEETEDFSLSLEEPLDSSDKQKAEVELGEALIRCRNLRQLCFSTKRIAGEDLLDGALDIATGNNPEFLSNCFNIVGARALATLIILGETLEVLRVSQCHIGLEGISVIFRALRRNRSLTWLEIAVGCTRLEPMDEKTMQEMIEGVSNHPNLLTLNIANNFFQDRHAKGLAEIVQNGNLQQLDLSCNALGLETARAISEVLPKSSLQSLNMARNHLYDEGAKAMAEGIRHAQCLRDLNLSLNQLRMKGCKAVLGALADNQSLQHLNISNNQIFYDSLLFEGVNRCRNLETLDIFWDGQDLDSLVIESVRRNRNLQQVRCYYRPDKDFLEKTMCEALQQNREKQAILRSNWARVSTLMAFERANHNSALRHSILPLLPEILKMTGCYQNHSKFL